MNNVKASIDLHPTDRNLLESAWRDAIGAIKSWRLWLILGYRDMRAQYSRSYFGPFWQTFHATIWIGALTFIFINVFNVVHERNIYIIYIALGLIIFNFINAVVTGSADIFIRSRILIHAFPAPIFTHPLRLVSSAVFQLLFQSMALIPFLVFFPIEYFTTVPLALIGLFLTVLMSISIATLIAIAGARFGDFQFIVLAVMRVMFFLTPIFWSLDQWSGAPLQLVTLNPITNFITIIRDPLLGQVPDLLVYIKVFFWLFVTTVLGAIWFVRARHTIPMWV